MPRILVLYTLLQINGTIHLGEIERRYNMITTLPLDSVLTSSIFTDLIVPLLVFRSPH